MELKMTPEEFKQLFGITGTPAVPFLAALDKAAPPVPTVEEKMMDVQIPEIKTPEAEANIEAVEAEAADGSLEVDKTHKWRGMWEGMSDVERLKYWLLFIYKNKYVCMNDLTQRGPTLSAGNRFSKEYNKVVQPLIDQGILLPARGFITFNVYHLDGWQIRRDRIVMNESPSPRKQKPVKIKKEKSSVNPFQYFKIPEYIEYRVLEHIENMKAFRINDVCLDVNDKIIDEPFIRQATMWWLKQHPDLHAERAKNATNPGRPYTFFPKKIVDGIVKIAGPYGEPKSTNTIRGASLRPAHFQNVQMPQDHWDREGIELDKRLKEEAARR